MGDKSPKSKSKNKAQKQGKAAASDKEKRRLTDSKKQGKPAEPARKK